jgi:poly(3-hydroxybutyrate) depolymerase
VETLLDAGVENIVAADWKTATGSMKDFDIDTYLAEIDVIVDELGGAAHLVGLCQGGWMSAILLGTPAANIVRREVPGGHIGPFTGTRTLAEVWPGVGHWIRDIDRSFAQAPARASRRAV